MDYKEIKLDLFSINKTASSPYCLAHCISSDFVLGAGIAVVFANKWNMREVLKKEYGDQTKEFDLFPSGKVFPVPVTDFNKDTIVYNLVTKRYCYQKPRYPSVAITLKLMRDDMLKKGLTRVAMPKIGCGIDGLEWRAVKDIIRASFQNINIEVRVCYL